MGKVIKVTNGVDTFDVNSDKLQFAIKDGFRPTERILVHSTKTGQTFEVNPEKVQEAYKDGYTFYDFVKKKGGLASAFSGVSKAVSESGGEAGISVPQSQGAYLNSEQSMQVYDRVKKQYEALNQTPFDENDPLKSALGSVKNRMAQLRQRPVSESTSTPVSRFNLSGEITGLVADKNAIKNFRLPTARQAERVLVDKVDQSKLQREKPLDITQSPSLDDFSLQSVIEATPKDNLTAQTILRQYVQNRKVREILSNSSSLDDAALKLARLQNEITGKQIEALYGNLPNNMKGDLVLDLLQNNDVQELASQDKELAAQIQREYSELPNKYPDAGVKLLSSLISNEREKRGENNWLLNVPGKKKSDEIVQDLFEQGKIPLQFYNFYQKPVIKEAVNAALKTPGFVENVLENAAYGTRSVGKTMAEVSGLRDQYSTPQDRLYSALEEQYGQVQFEPKGFGHKVSSAAGLVTGQVLPMMLGGTAMKSLNLVKSEAASNAIMAGLQTWGDNRDKALVDLPGASPEKQAAYATINTGLEILFSNVLNETKLARKLVQKAAPEIKSVLTKFTDEEITAAAAQKATESIAQKYLRIGGQFAKGTAKTAFSEANEEGATQLLQNLTQQVFQGTPIDLSKALDDAGQVWATTFLGTIPLGIAGGVANVKTNKAMPELMIEMANNPEKFKSVIEREAATDPKYAQDVEQKLSNLQHIVQTKKALDGTNLNDKQKGEFLVRSLAEKILQDKKSKTTDKTLAAKDDKAIKELEIEKQAILDDKSDTEVLQEFYENDLLGKGSMDMLTGEDGKFSKNKASSYLKFIAQQSNNLDENWEPNKGNAPSMDEVPDAVIKMANRKFKNEIEEVQSKQEQVILPDQNREIDMGSDEITKPIELSTELPEDYKLPDQKEKGKVEGEEKVDLTNLTSEQLAELQVEAKKAQKNRLIDEMGEKWYGKYQMASEEQKSKMEAQLSPAQRRVFNGEGLPDNQNPEVIREIRASVAAIESAETAGEIANEVANSVINISQNRKIEQAKAVLNAAKRRASEIGIDETELTQVVKNAIEGKVGAEIANEILNQTFAQGENIQQAIEGTQPVAAEEEAQPNFEPVEVSEGAVPPTEPPTAEPPTEERERPLNDKAILNRLYNSKYIPESVKKGFEAVGLKYETRGMEENEAVAKGIIDEFGIDEAVRMAESNTFKGGVRSAVFAEALNQLTEQESSAKDPQSKIDAAKKFAEIALRYDEFSREQGRDIAQIQLFYKKSPLGVIMYDNMKRAEDFNKWANNKEKSWQQVYDELIKVPEFEEIVKEQVKEQLKKERSESRAKREKKVKDIFKSAKDKFKGGAAYSTIIPPKIITGALDLMEKLYLAGEKVAEVVQKGIDYINEQMGNAPWDKDKFRKEWEEKLKEQDATKNKGLTDEELKLRVLSKFRKKLKGLTEKQKEEVITKSYRKLIDNRALEFDDFKQIIAKVVGRGELTVEQAEKMKQLVKDTNAVEDAAQKLRDEKSKEAYAEFREAQKKAGRAYRDLSELFFNKTDLLKRLTSIMQLNTLTVPSLINNPIYNIWNQALLRFPIGLINDLVDRGISLAAKAGGKNYDREFNVLGTQADFFNGLGLGAKESMEQLLTGLNRQDYLQKEVYGQQIRPIKAWKDLIGFARGKKELKKVDVIDRMLQGSVGIPAEIVARLLNIGDKPQRFGAESAQGAAFAKALGLKGIDKDIFKEFPKEEAYKYYKGQGLSDKEATEKAEYIQQSIVQEGKRSTFQQDNLLNDMITSAFNILEQKAGLEKDSGIGALTKALVISPYIKIPLNSFWSFYNLLNPEIAIMQSLIYGGRARLYKNKGENVRSKMSMREARYWYAHAIVGMVLRAIIIPLVAQGVFTPASDDEETKKERDAMSLYSKGGTTRIKGYDVSNRWMGAFGMLGNSIAKKYKDMTPEQKENQEEFWNIVFGGMEKEGLKELENGIFANTSSLFQALGSNDWSRYGMNTINLITNILQPGSVAQFNRSALDYVPTSQGDGFLDRLNQNFAQRSTLYRKVFDTNIRYKRDIWGDMIPKGGNTLSRAFGISKADPKVGLREIYNEYLKTNDIGFLPPAVVNSLNGKKLPVAQYDLLQQYIGGSRKALVEPFVNNMMAIPGYGLWSTVEDKEAKKELLQTLYSKGREIGLEKFYQDFPELRPKNEDSEKERRKEMKSELGDMFD